jgi:hypothetical protein
VTSAQPRIPRRHQEAVLDALDDDRLGFRFRALGDPFLVLLERAPFLLALGQAFPFQQVGQRLVAGADERGPEADRLDAVFFEKLQGDVLEAGIQRRQAAGRAVVDTQFMDQGFGRSVVKEDRSVKFLASRR